MPSSTASASNPSSAPSAATAWPAWSSASEAPRPRSRRAVMAMPDEAKPAESMHLTVLPSSNKVEQLRNEFATDAGAGKPDERKKLAEQNVIDRALDASKTPEQKR